MAQWQEKESYTAEDLIAIVQRLRDPANGCPWDRVQTHASIRKNFLEETCEVLEAIDAEDPHLMEEELGDVLMQIALHSCMETERGTFTFSDVCTGVCQKLISRHPHIFPQKNDVPVRLSDWDTLKNKEKGRQTLADELNTVPATLPALMKAQKLQKRAARYGAQTQDAAQAAQTLDTAYAALRGQLATPPLPATPDAPVVANPANAAAGAFLFAAANWLRCAGVDAEEALALCCRDFAQTLAEQ